MWRRLIDLDHANHARLPLYQCPATVGVAQPGGSETVAPSPCARRGAWPPSAARLTVMGIGTVGVIRFRFFAPQNPKRPPIWGVDLKEVDGLGAPAEAVLG